MKKVLLFNTNNIGSYNEPRKKYEYLVNKKISISLLFLRSLLPKIIVLSISNTVIFADSYVSFPIQKKFLTLTLSVALSIRLFILR